MLGAGVICDTRSKDEIDEELRLIQMCFDEGQILNLSRNIHITIDIILIIYIETNKCWFVT